MHHAPLSCRQCCDIIKMNAVACEETGGLEEGKMAHRDSHGPREGHFLVGVCRKVFPQALTIGRLEGHRAASEAGCKVLPGCD